MSVERPDLEALLRQGRGKGRMRSALIATAVLAALGLGLWYWLGSGAQGPAAVHVTAPAVRGDLTVTITATGTVEPTNQVEISSELSGTVRAVLVDYNDPVRVGTVLAQLDTEKLEANIAHSRATVEARAARVQEAGASETEALAQLERIRSLASRDFAAAQTLEAAVAAHARAVAGTAVARADMKVAEADLAINETNLAKACICSPIDGVVLDRNVDAGQIVASALQAPVLFTIAEDLSKMELRVDIDEADIGAVRVGNPATFTVEAHRDLSFPAEIASVRYAPQTVDGVVTYKAILSIDNSDLMLRPGMTATAEIIVEEVADALMIPNAALRYAPPAETEETSNRAGGLLGLLMPRPPQTGGTAMPAPGPDGSRTIWVLRDGAPVAVQVWTGTSDGLLTVVVEGDLAEGDRVIVDQLETG